MSAARNWTFTIFDVKNIKWLENENIVYYGYEPETCPKTKREHLQGFLQLREKKRLTWIRNNINKSAHLEVMRGTYDENKKYCSKDGKFIECGIFTRKGERKDLQKVYEEIAEGTYKPGPEYIQYHSGIDKLIEKISEEKDKENFKKEFNSEHKELNEYQKDWKKHLDEQENRKVTWINDEVGNKGKSYFADYLVANENAVVFQSSNLRDIAYTYKSEPIVIFDLSRNDQAEINYSIIEHLKNGRIFSGKYQSKTKYFKKPKIIVMSNSYPDTKKLSMDRWDIINYDREGNVKYGFSCQRNESDCNM